MSLADDVTEAQSAITGLRRALLARLLEVRELLDAGEEMLAAVRLDDLIKSVGDSA